MSESNIFEDQKQIGFDRPAAVGQSPQASRERPAPR